MDFESAKEKRVETRAEGESTFEIAKTGIEGIAEESRFFSDETKAAITRALDVTLDDFMSDVLDKSASPEYKRRSSRGQMYLYLRNRIKEKVYVPAGSKEEEELYHLLRWAEGVTS